MKYVTKLIIGNKEIDLLKYRYGFTKQVNIQKKPDQLASFRGLEMTVATTEYTFFEEWILSEEVKPKIELHIYYPYLDEGSCKKMIFYDAFLIHHKTIFSADNSGPMKEELKITCAGIKTPNTEEQYTTSWRKTFEQIEPENIPVTTNSSIKKPKILNAYWLKSDNTKLKQEKGLTTNVVYGEKIHIKLEGNQESIGKEVEVLIRAKIGINEAYIDDSRKPYQKKLNFIMDDKEQLSPEFLIDLNWYNEEREKQYDKDKNVNGYDFKAFQTVLPPKQAILFTFEIKFKEKKDFKEYSEKLIPVTYRRNYEELMGLFEYKNPGTPIDMDDVKPLSPSNVETHFVNSNKKIKAIVDDFIKEIYNEEFTGLDILKSVNKYSEKLWSTAVDEVQKGQLDDRPLYWARIKMQIYLKRHPIYKNEFDSETSTATKGKALETAINNFEIFSRNYKNINFSKAGTNDKKLLMLGFDPFGLRRNTLQSNPSGVSILNLHNQNIGGYHIQCFMMPVRYKDFDEFRNGNGIIEQFVEPFIKEVHMIITISQTVPLRFNIDRFASKTREGQLDNMYWGEKRHDGNDKYFQQIKPLKLPPYKTVTNEEFYETTLPIDKIVLKDAKQSFYKFPVFFNQTFEATDNSTPIWFNDKYLEGFKKIEDRNIINPSNISLGLTQVSSFKLKYLQGATITSVKGSGSYYLSNESFYRVARLRDNFYKNLIGSHNKKLKTGHFHIPMIQNDQLMQFTTQASKERLTSGFDELKVDLDPIYIAEVVRIVEELIIKSNK